ncbi:MAG: hypothetical protein KGI42_00035 [Xanthomonadaceae bacterium]|nr:hypothetical protein [Xanthomonadaceae bacterium]
MPLDDDTRALLRRLRRRPEPRATAQRRLAAGLVAVLHVFFAVVLWHAMQPRPVAPPAFRDDANDATVLQVRFIPSGAEAAPVPPPPPPPIRPPPATRQPVAREAPVARAPRRSAAAPTSASAPSRLPALFDRDGVARLPAASSSTSAPVPDYIPHKPTGDMQVMQHTTPLPYRPTRFEKYFPPPGENAAQAGLRKLVGALEGKGPSSKTVNLPRGVHLKCRTLLGVPTPFCGLPPAPPPPNDGDERLNMPAVPLAGDPHAPPLPSLATCIAAYRAQGPLPYGCPVDTPARAVDEELSDCVARYRAGKRLPTWCPADTARRAGASTKAGPGTP